MLSALVVAALVTAALALGLAASPAFADGTVPTAGVVPPWAKVQGRTYGQWSAAQWQWTLQQPNVLNSPVVDPNPGTAAQPEAVDCTLDQSGRVWFLAGATFLQPYSIAYRSCSIPAGVFLFFPVIDVWQDDLNCYPQPPFTLSATQLQQNVQQQTDTIVPNSMSVTIDGRAVTGLTDSTTAYRAAANAFSYTLPDNNALSLACLPGPSFPAGTKPPNPPGAYADSVYIMLTPLTLGVHHIHFAAQESGATFGPATQNVFYTITVTPLP